MGFFNRASSSNSYNAEKLAKEGITKYLQKDYLGAIKYLTKAIEVNSTRAIFYKYRGNAYEDLKDYRNALRDYFSANRLHEHHTNYHSIGFCYMQLNERQPAVDAYNNALRLKINNPEEKGDTQVKNGIPVCISIEVLYNNRAAARLKIQDFEGALSDVETALRNNPNYTQAEITKGLIEMQQGFSILNQNRDSSNELSKEEFMESIIEYANSDRNVMPNNIRLRDEIFLNHAEQFVRLGTISFDRVLSLAKEYGQNLFKAYEYSNSSTADDFMKGVMLYELSCALSKIYPSIEPEEIVGELIDRLI